MGNLLTKNPYEKYFVGFTSSMEFYLGERVFKVRE